MTENTVRRRSLIAKMVVATGIATCWVVLRPNGPLQAVVTVTSSSTATIASTPAPKPAS